MKNTLCFIVGCLFVATLSGCIVVPTGHAPGGYVYYNDNGLSLAAARINYVNSAIFSSGGYYAPVVVPLAVNDRCYGLTPFQCVGLDINKNANSGHGGFKNNQGYNNKGNHSGGKSNDNHNNHRRGGDNRGRR